MNEETTSNAEFVKRFLESQYNNALKVPYREKPVERLNETNGRD